MPLLLHPQAKASMVEALRLGLEYVRIKNGMFPDRFSTFIASYDADNKLPAQGQLRDRLIEYTDDQPFVDFFTDEIGQDFRDNFDYIADDELRVLAAFAGYENLQEVADRYVTSFESLPWQYTVTVSLPSALFYQEFFAERSYPLGSQVTVAKHDLLFSETYPLTHQNANRAKRAVRGGFSILGLGEAKWPADNPFYQIKASGYIGMYGGGNTVSHIERQLESFFGLGLATKLFTHNVDYSIPEFREDWIAHIRVGETWEFSSRFDVNNSIRSVLRYIKCFSFKDEYAVERRVPWLQNIMDRLNRIFQMEEAATVRLAAKWYFDSFKSDDLALRYIRLMTSLEILLGSGSDSNRLSLGETIGNRLAYLVGKTHKDRTEILRDFKKVYGIRSGILHQGKHRLTGEERSSFIRLRAYCERALDREVEMLLA